tara:strand:+ start:13353 stop:14615 length:1263 start_codon:yes stop_codon:yes gene_type:complete
MQFLPVLFSRASTRRASSARASHARSPRARSRAVDPSSRSRRASSLASRFAVDATAAFRFPRRSCFRPIDRPIDRPFVRIRVVGARAVGCSGDEDARHVATRAMSRARGIARATRGGEVARRAVATTSTATATATRDDDDATGERLKRALRRCDDAWALDGTTHGARLALMPRRRCVGVNAHFPRALLVRYVLAMDGEKRRWVAPDARGEREGRGAYASADPRALEMAMKKRGFEMAFKTKDIHVPEKLAEMTRRQLRAHVRELFARACGSAREALAGNAGNGEESRAQTTPRTVEEEIEKLIETQKRIVAEDWILIPSDSRARDGAGDDETHEERRGSAESDAVRGVGYKLDALSMDELTACLDAADADESVLKRIRDGLKKFQTTGNLSDAPKLVDVNEDVSLGLRIAQIKVKLFERT